MARPLTEFCSKLKAMALRMPISDTKASDRGSRFGDVNVPLKLRHYSITLLPVFVAKAPDLLKPFSGAKSSVSLEPDRGC